MSLINTVPTIKKENWESAIEFSKRVRQALQQLSHLRLGVDASPTFESLTLDGLTATRLVQTDASKKLTSVSDLTSWVAGTANEIDIADDGDGTITIGIVNPLIVGKGGTGTDALTDHSLLVGSGADAVTLLGVASNGQLPIGSAGADPVLAVLTGTAKQVLVANAAGSITLSTPQDIDTDSTPTFANLSLGTGELTCGSINRAADTLTLEIGGVAQVTITDSTVTYAGDVHITGTTTYDSNIIIPDDGWIGSVTTNQAVQIASTGNVTMPGTLNVTGDLAVTGNISLTVNNGSVGYTDNSPMLVFNNTDDRVELTGAAGLAFTAASGVITQDTADGSDSGVIQFCGGGVVGNTRGGYCNLFGNEHISAPGCVEFVAGNVTGGHVKFYTGNNLERVRIDKDGLISLYGNLVIPDAGYIGSVGGTDAIQIDASGNTTFSVFPITPSAEPDADYEVANKKYVDDHAGGVSTWIALTDTDPANYTGEAGNCVVVNAGEDGLEFGAAPGGGGITNLDGGKSDSSYAAVGLSPIDGGDST